MPQAANIEKAVEVHFQRMVGAVAKIGLVGKRFDGVHALQRLNQNRLKARIISISLLHALTQGAKGNRYGNRHDNADPQYYGGQLHVVKKEKRQNHKE